MTHKKSHNRFYPIAGYPGYWIQKSTTNVLCTNEDYPVILPQTPNSKGDDNYYVVTLNDGKNHFVHRIMAETFLPGPSKPQVNHIDGDKHNNSLENLEWVTSSENTQHAYDTGLASIEHAYVAVHQYTLGGEYLASFRSAIFAEASTGVQRQNISKCSLGKREAAGGYMWRPVMMPQIAPYTGAPILKGIQVTSSGGTMSFITPRGQDFYTELLEVTQLRRHTIEKAFRKANGTPVYIKGYRLDKVYYE